MRNTKLQNRYKGLQKQQVLPPANERAKGNIHSKCVIFAQSKTETEIEMHTKKLLLFLPLIVILSCSPSERNNYTIYGEFENASGEMIYLMEMTSEEIIPADSVIADRNGVFTFSGEIGKPRFLVIQDKPSNNLTLLVSPGEEIFVSGDIDDIRRSYHVDGSPGSERVMRLNREMDGTLDKLDSLGQVYRSKLNEPGTDIEELRADTREKFDSITERQRQFTIGFIEEDPASLASLMALYMQIDHTTFVLGQPGDLKYYKMVDSALYEKYPGLDYVVTLNENIGEMETNIEMRRLREESLQSGSKAPEIALPGRDGDTITLSSLRGRYVLLNFWASWSEESRDENSRLIEIYKRFNHHGLEILQVSLDRNRESWLRGIREDRTGEWIHASDLQFWSSSVVPVYRIDALPASFLIDREGRIMAVSASADSLAEIIEPILN